jgi:hypothetical protein
MSKQPFLKNPSLLMLRHFWESRLVHNQNELSMISPNFKVLKCQTVNKGSALFYCPEKGKQFQLEEETCGLVVRRKTHDREVLGSNPH